MTLDGYTAAVSPEILAAVGAAVAILALLTALINHRSAFVNLRSAKATAGAPALPSMAAEPRVQLPARPHVVDREDAMRQAADLIRNGEPVLAIEGEIGAGKSTVAKELAHRLTTPGVASSPMPDVRHHQTFFWIDGANGCPRLVDICASLALLTGDQSLSTVADDRKLDALRAHLAGNRTLLLLDNLRLGDDPESDLIRELLRTVPEGTLVIASANRRGELEAAPVSLDELRPSDVLELIQYEAQRLNLAEAAAFDDAFAARLQGAVGANPGRIAWFLRGQRGSARAVEERLAALERGEGLATLFAPVWEDLSGDARIVLAACAYLRGQAILEQLAIATGLERDETSAVLEDLIEVGLVTTVAVTGRPNVFSCPHGVQRFVRFETPEASIDDFTRRLAGRYIAYFRANSEDARAAIPHVGVLRPVLEELAAHGENYDLQGLAAASEDILFSLGLFDARIACGTISYESAVLAGDHRAASLASEVLSSTHVIRGEFDEARAALALGALAAERSGDPGELARQMRCRGWVHYRSGEPQQALAAIEGADDLARAGGALHTLVNILNLRSYANWYLGALDESEAAARASLSVADQISWERAKAFPIRQLAELAINRGEFDKARDLLERARGIVLEAEDKRHLTRLHLTEARLGLISGDLRGARAAAARGEADAITLGLPPEQREARALRNAATRSYAFAPLRAYYRWRRPTRLTDAPVF